MKAIINTVTKEVLVTEPLPTRPDGSVLLPNVDFPVSVVDLTASQLQVLTDAATASSDEIAAIAAQTAQVRALAQTAVGVNVADLSAAQRNALLVCLLYKFGAITNDLKIVPLTQWVRRG